VARDGGKAQIPNLGLNARLPLFLSPRFSPFLGWRLEEKEREKERRGGGKRDEGRKRKS
jgi:hypothetical protein